MGHCICFNKHVNNYTSQLVMANFQTATCGTEWRSKWFWVNEWSLDWQTTTLTQECPWSAGLFGWSNCLSPNLLELFIIVWLFKVLQLERHPGIEDGTLSIMADWSSTPYGGMCVYYVTSTRQAWSSSAVVFDMAPPQHNQPSRWWWSSQCFFEQNDK